MDVTRTHITILLPGMSSAKADRASLRLALAS
jgi:hypothetical protein